MSGISDQRLLEPGWAGELTDKELAYIQQELFADDKLSYLWGFARSLKTRPLEAIRRVAMDGDPERRSVNLPLARPRRAKAGAEVAVGRAKAGAEVAVGRANSDLLPVG